MGRFPTAVLYIALAAVVLTAFYMTRLMAEVFFGPARPVDAAFFATRTKKKPLTPALMTVPLILLAVGAIVPRLPLARPRFPGCRPACSARRSGRELALQGSLSGAAELSIIFIATVVAILGILGAYGRGSSTLRVREARPGVAAIRRVPRLRCSPRSSAGLCRQFADFDAADIDQTSSSARSAISPAS